MNPVRLLTIGLMICTASSALAQANDPMIAPANKIVTPKPGEPLSIVAEANLKKARPAAPFNATGMWQLEGTDHSHGLDWEFLPLPKFTPAGQAAYDAKLKADKDGVANATDLDASACYPVGMPRIMTRVWPQQMIQLPTAIIMIAGFTNQVRWIYLDGRPHTDPDLTPSTYNGESVGHWEGDELVVDTNNFIGTHKWIQVGAPSSDQLHIVEHWKMEDGGKTLSIRFVMTDPVNWVGEWTGTKRFFIHDERDIVASPCIAADMARLPSSGRRR